MGSCPAFINTPDKKNCPPNWEPLFLKRYDSPVKVAIIGFNSAQYTRKPLGKERLKSIEAQIKEEKCKEAGVDRV